jgi:epoxyqueuosine reductase QueG
MAKKGGFCMKERLRQLALGLGADASGFARASDFADAPEGFRPTDAWNACESVMVIALALPMGAMLSGTRLSYTRFNNLMTQKVDGLTLDIARAVERETGRPCVPLPSDDPYDDYDPSTRAGRGVISMKHAAVRAGLGRLGKSTLLLNRSFGNRLTIGALLLNIALESDPLAPEVCLPGCRMCVDACPAGAIVNGAVVQAKCREIAYVTNARGFSVTNCHACRDVCPVRFGREGSLR